MRCNDDGSLIVAAIGLKLLEPDYYLIGPELLALARCVPVLWPVIVIDCSDNLILPGQKLL